MALNQNKRHILLDKYKPAVVGEFLVWHDIVLWYLGCMVRVVSLPVTTLSYRKIKWNFNVVIFTECDLIHVVNNGLLNKLKCDKRSRINSSFGIYLADSCVLCEIRFYSIPSHHDRRSDFNSNNKYVNILIFFINTLIKESLIKRRSLSGFKTWTMSTSPK